MRVSKVGQVRLSNARDPDLNPTYYNFALHCGLGIVPARPYKPRDKAKVENAVQVAQRWIVAALRHHKFFSLEERVEAAAERALLAGACRYKSVIRHSDRWSHRVGVN